MVIGISNTRRTHSPLLYLLSSRVNYTHIQVKKCSKESTRQKNKILILLNIIGLSMCMVVPVLVVRISTVNKGLSSQY